MKSAKSCGRKRDVSHVGTGIYQELSEERKRKERVRKVDEEDPRERPSRNPSPPSP